MFLFITVTAITYGLHIEGGGLRDQKPLPKLFNPPCSTYIIHEHNYRTDLPYLYYVNNNKRLALYL